MCPIFAWKRISETCNSNIDNYTETIFSIFISWMSSNIYVIFQNLEEYNHNYYLILRLTIGLVCIFEFPLQVLLNLNHKKQNISCLTFYFQYPYWWLLIIPNFLDYDFLVEHPTWFDWITSRSYRSLFPTFLITHSCRRMKNAGDFGFFVCTKTSYDEHFSRREVVYVLIRVPVSYRSFLIKILHWAIEKYLL